MKTNHMLITLTNSLGLAVLLGAGVWLFHLREHKWSQTIAHEMNINAQAARQLIIKGQFLIYVPKPPEDLESILGRLDLESTMPMLDWLLVSRKGHAKPPVIPISSPEAYEDRLILTSLLEHPHILDAQHNFVLEPTITPSNRHFAKEWQLQMATPKNPSGMNMPAAWEITQGTSKSELAVVDEFILADHLTFSERFSACAGRVHYFAPYPQLRSTSESSSIPHGEIMLLALGACSNLEPYSTGMDWYANIVAVERSSSGQAQSFLAALAASGIDVCQESVLPCPAGITGQYQVPKPRILLLPFTNNSPDSLQFSANMVNAISSRNIIVVTPAGNNNLDASSFFPGAAPGVINVGALNRWGQRAKFSNWGPSVHVLAPGDNIDFGYPSGSKGAQGSSIAAAYVAGALSLMVTLDPDLSYKRARYILRETAQPINCDNYCAHTLGTEAQGSCASLCCQGQTMGCGAAAMDVYQALKLTKTKIINAPLLELDQNYLVFLRAFSQAQQVVVRNVGDVEAEVEAIAYEDNLITSPKSFTLSPRTGADSSQVVHISFKKEPFTRSTHKVELLTKKQGQVVDRAEVYVEYIPKK